MTLLDTGVLVSIDRNELAAIAFVEQAWRRGEPLHTTAPVVGQVWRDARQALLSRFLKGIEVHPFNEGHGRQVGQLLGINGSADVVDAHLVIVASQMRLPILTGDPGDIGPLADDVKGSRPNVMAWPRTVSGAEIPLHHGRGSSVSGLGPQ